MTAEPRDQTAVETGVWYCPVCGYVDPGTRAVRCPQQHPDGRWPMFRQINRGFYVRVGVEESDE